MGKSRHTDSFVLAEYSGMSAEVLLLIDAIRRIMKAEPALRAHLLPVYDRLIWCDRVTIHFHPRGLEP